jgi:hypothetical protein
MRYGVSFPVAGLLSDLRIVGQLARQIEDTGWDGCFVWDHLSMGAMRVADPWLALAIIAETTKRVRLGPLVTPIFRRHVEKLAHETITLDHLSCGRMIFGAGLGSDRFGEISAFGGPLSDRARAAVMDETLAALIGLWSGRAFSYEGRYHQFKEAQIIPGCVQSPRIPIWIAASSSRRPPMHRASCYEGIVPVGGDLKRCLTITELQGIVSYVRALRAPHLPFDVIHFGEISDLSNAQARDTISAYEEIGVTWWIETLPYESNDLRKILDRISLRPPLC